MNKSRKVISKKSILNSSDFIWRIYVILFSIFFVFAAVVFRLFSLQVIANETYLEIAQNQHNMTAKIEADRGEVFLQDDKELYPLAVNRQFKMAYAVPRDIEDREYFTEKVSTILSLDRGEIANKVLDQDDPFEILKKKLSDEEVAKVKELNLKGLGLTSEIYRYYPAGELTSQVIGFVGSDGENRRGMYGIEAFWENELKGSSSI